MRISTNPKDPGYAVWAGILNRNQTRVFLAGSERSNVVTADEEQRYALVYRLGPDGNIQTKDGEILFDDFYGDVRIELPDQDIVYDEDGSPAIWPFPVGP